MSIQSGKKEKLFSIIHEMKVRSGARLVIFPSSFTRESHRQTANIIGLLFSLNLRKTTDPLTEPTETTKRFPP